MKTTSLCEHHKKQILQSENTAFSYWQMMMRNGMQYYTNCQNSDAEKYFNSAFEIALLRFPHKEKVFFSATHLIKPAEFLVTIQSEQENFNKALLLLSKISSLSDSENIRKERDLWGFLSEQYQHITDAKNKINDSSIIFPQLTPCISLVVTH